MCRCISWIAWATCLVTMAALSSGVVAEEPPFDYFRNSFNVVGLKDYDQGARVTPENDILLAGTGKNTVHYAGRLRLRFGRALTPLSRRQTKTCLEGWLPVMQLTAADGPVRYDFAYWATPLPNVKDWRRAYDWPPPEGENFLVWVTVTAINTGDQPAEARLRAEQTGPGAPSGPRTFAWTLEAGKSARAVIRVPFLPVETPSAFDKEDPDVWLRRTVDFWKDALAGAARIQTPCRKSNQTLLAAHVCQFIANDGGQLQGGEGFYDHFYIRDGAYQIMQLEEAGLADAAAKAIEFYFAAQRPDGRFESQHNQYDANGQAIWTLWQYWKITGDRDWLAKVYPRMRRAVDWATKSRRLAPPGSPFAGLMPPGPGDGECLWDGKHHIVGYDLWNLRGMLLAADAARALGKAGEADELDREAGEYRKDIDAAWKRTGLPHFPASWEKAGTHWGNTETLWPTPIFAADDPRVAALVDEVRRNHGGGFIEGTIQWLGRPGAIHPYMGSYTTMVDLLRGRHEAFVEDYYWYLLHTTASHAFPEGIYYKPRIAWSNTIPHVTGASNFAFQLRHMLVDERGDELHLLAGVPDWWLGEGQQIRVERAPTHFGAVGLTVQGRARGVEVRLDGPARSKPRRIVLHLPKSRPLVGQAVGMEVVVRSDQAKRWDFPTVIELYRKQTPQVAPIPGVVELPVGEVAKDKCVALDLKGVAVTDPFKAPFGVRPPSPDFLFTGLPVGKTTAGGVPFDLIDPAANGGRGLVVLHSPRAPKGVNLPTQVEIAVNQQGRRMFFLGNVHGWDSHDAGAGPQGAVAEYVIQYADGQRQVVPLVTGRTIDEWAAPPEANDVEAALSGKRWHLNLLGVTLRPAVVEKIVFRDLGTPSAPVLAAVTLEK